LKERQQSCPRPPKAGQGALPACGSAAGNPLDGEPGPDDPDAIDEVDQEMQRQAISEKIVQHQRRMGSVPAGLALFAEGEIPKPTVCWERELQIAVGRAIRHKAGSIDYTYSQRSRHQSSLDLHFGEGAPVIPGMWAPLAEVALVIDTSGSMTSQMLRVLGEASGLLQSMGGAKVSLIACDAEVQAIASVRSLKEVKERLKGGGGTDFRPAFRHLEGLRRNRPDVVVFATDGYGVYPNHPPKWRHIWLLFDGEIGVDWGKVIELEVAA
jgi:predicted metal-dependent peptidase